MNDVLNFLSSLLWPVVVVWIVWTFRSDLQKLIDRIASIKHGDTEVLFQEPSSEPLESSDLVGKAMDIRDEEGFFHQESIEQMVKNSAHISEGDVVKDSLLVFATRLQRTWLVSTNKQVFFVLDDERTRASKKLIQTRLQIASASPVHVELRKGRIGAFRLGEGGSWLYSVDLLGPPSMAKKRLSRFLGEAAK